MSTNSQTYQIWYSMQLTSWLAKQPIKVSTSRNFLLLAVTTFIQLLLTSQQVLSLKKCLLSSSDQISQICQCTQSEATMTLTLTGPKNFSSRWLNVNGNCHHSTTQSWFHLGRMEKSWACSLLIQCSCSAPTTPVRNWKKLLCMTKNWSDLDKLLVKIQLGWHGVTLSTPGFSKQWKNGTKIQILSGKSPCNIIQCSHFITPLPIICKSWITSCPSCNNITLTCTWTVTNTCLPTLTFPTLLQKSLSLSLCWRKSKSVNCIKRVTTQRRQKAQRTKFATQTLCNGLATLRFLPRQ